MSQSKISNKQAPNPIGECPICFGSGPVVQVSAQCHWHEAACYRCLRQMYVTEAQKDAKNYPLRCFHPQCRQRIHPYELQSSNLIQSESEKKKHSQMHTEAKRLQKEAINGPIQVKHQALMEESKERRLAKVLERNKSRGLRTVHCPHCHVPSGVGIVAGNKVASCKKCHLDYFLSPNFPTYHALEKIQKDKFGANCGLGHCPKCGIVICKGDGCPHMVCGYCHADFRWTDAGVQIPRLAYPHPTEIHMWW